MFAVLILAALLPAHLDPPVPFPHIVTQAPSISQVAPGVEYGEYDLLTDAGPIAVHVLAVAPRAPDIKLGSVLADDTLTSPGETISSMADRTNAVAGINADYFDIGNTNRPTNIVVHDAQLLRTPRKRYALVITSNGLPQIIETSFTGTVSIGGRSVMLDGVNELPPPGSGTSIVTPAFGPVPAQENLTLVALAPVNGTPPLCTYRVTGIADNSVRAQPGYYLAIGLNAYGSTGVPDAGDTIVTSGDLSPISLGDITAAVGGGPLLLDRGVPVDDPDGPEGPEFALRIPASGAGITPTGMLLFFQVDGREPDHSIGVTRPEFAALMRAFGTSRAMAFDGGGSSEMAVRMPTQLDATLQNVPSDGRERKVADGIFIYDTAPAGVATHILTAPQAIHAMTGAHVPIRVALGDDRDRVTAGTGTVEVRVEPADLGAVAGGEFVAGHSGDGEILVRDGTFTRAIPVRVTDDPSRVEILPREPSAPDGGVVALRARAFDAQGYALALPAALPWRALHGTIDGRGELTVGSQDALVSLLLGDHLANAPVTVGFHDVPLVAANPRVMTAPRDGNADVTAGVPCDRCVQLRYALGNGERAAYLVLETALPAHSVSVAFDVLDDGHGGILKLALRNAIAEEVLLTAGRLDRPGWRTVEVRLPPELAQPARLTAVYVIGKKASETIQGTIAIRNLHAVVAGTATARP